MHQSLTQRLRRPSCLDDWELLHRRPSVCPVRMQVTKLHGAITLHGAIRFS